MSTEQTDRLEMDSTESQPRIEPSVLVAAPLGGDPTPLPRRRAAHGTRTGMRAAPPPIPARVSSAAILPPPIPARATAAMPTADGSVEVSFASDTPRPRAAASTLPDPDGWALPGVYHAEPAAPDVTVPAGHVDAALIVNAHKHAVAAVSDAEREQAAAIAAAVEAAAAAAAHAARANDALAAGTPAPTLVNTADEAARVAAANAAANAALPKLPTVRATTKPPLPGGPRLPAPRAGSTTRPPVPAVATAAAAMFTTKAEAPSLTAPLELVDLEAIDAPAAPAKPAPVVHEGEHVSPLVAAARASISAEHAGAFDVEWDNPDLTTAHTTNFELPTKSKLPQRAALGLFVAATFATVGYLATRSTSPKHTAAPAPVAAHTAPAPAVGAPPPAPAPAVQAIATPAAPATETATPGQPQLVSLPVSSTPPGAMVTFVDGDKAEVVGRTPTTIKIDVSKPHDIALTMVGRETQLEHVPVGGLTALAVTLPLKEGAAPAVAESPAPARVANRDASDEQVATMVPAHTETPAPRHHATAPVKETRAPVKAAPQHITTPAPRAATAAPPAGSGMLMISSKPPCEIVVDGKSTHLQTPQKAIPLPPGTHTIMLVNAALKIHKSVTVDIVAKKPTKVIQDFTKH